MRSIFLTGKDVLEEKSIYYNSSQGRERLLAAELHSCRQFECEINPGSLKSQCTIVELTEVNNNIVII